MREIKFRGKRVDNGEWVFGNLRLKEDSFGKLSVIETSRPEYCFENHQVIPETVGQFIGRYDKNGKEIYEGDKVNIVAPSYDYKSYKNEVVKWDPDRAGFSPWTECSAQIDIAELATSESRLIEIIGNIHEPL